MASDGGRADRDGRREVPDDEWVALHVPRFREVRARYVTFASFLEVLLRQACATLAPESIVAARAKTISSFAEKILRKRRTYEDPAGTSIVDPLVRMTDLCGARVITNHADQIAPVSAFIERAFDIDWPNSEDASRRHRASEFGYRSVHYIVMVNPEKLRAAGFPVDVPQDVVQPLPLKSEIQVRTLLEHAWAQMAHDAAYKSEARISAPLRRRFSAMAAVLENADREFGALLNSLEAYRSNLGAYHTDAEVEAEIARLRIVLAQDPDNVDQAVRIATLAAGIGRQDLAVDVLTPYASRSHQGVERTMGLAMCDQHWDRTSSSAYGEGRAMLERACAHEKPDAETLSLLAETWRDRDKARARDLFRRASAVDPGEPLTLSRYLEFEMDHHSSVQVISLAAPMMRGVMARCRTQIDGRVNLPRAWACLGMFHLLLGEPFEAVRAAAELVALCAPPADGRGYSAASRELIRLRESLDRYRVVRNDLPGFGWLSRLVQLGLAVRVHDDQAMAAVRGLATPDKAQPLFTADERVVILSGGCAAEAQPFVHAFRPQLLDGCVGVSFTVVSGGTSMGVSGVAGDLAEASGGAVRAVGYLPGALPVGTPADTNPRRYATLHTTSGADFTPLEPLQGWIDLIAAGVTPGRVKLLAYAGGDITRVECAVARALGARVAVIEDPALPPRRRLDDVTEGDPPHAIRLPFDRMSIRAFLLGDDVAAPHPELERAARRVHENYLRSATSTEPSLRPWDELSADLRASNFHQVAYAEHILRAAGLGIRPLADPHGPAIDLDAVIGEVGMRRLAEMEHGRWNVERLLRGWRYAPTKDVAAKRSPYLVPWPQLSAEIQAYDLSAVRALPSMFREAGFEVFVLEASS